MTAVDAEKAAVERALPAGAPVRVAVGGVGPAAAAAATALSVDDDTVLVVSAGIAGGFAPVRPGDVVVAATIVHADLGAETAAGFAPMSSLGFGRERYDVVPALAVELADRTGGHLGSILTVSTVTGSAESAAQLVGRHPDAVGEAMEGAGVAAAAVACGVPFAEIRAVSNHVGPRDRGAWSVHQALAALGPAITAAVGRGTEGLV